MADSATDYATIKRLFDDGEIDVAVLGERLGDGWARSYRAQSRANDSPELLEVDQSGATYLFDLTLQRVVGVYGKSSPTDASRPARRMRGFPLPLNTPGLVRGHLVAHSIGGGTDINLIPQDAHLNISAGWRRLERLAQADPGCFLAIEARYDDPSQTPAELIYLVAANGALVYEQFSNR